ncbi:MAG: hypothetical protein MUF71_13075 [Candidatus Kapabacteria bacterium]|nr:hypothetical protein [Candidatus Kapabacteria bacterium]
MKFLFFIVFLTLAAAHALAFAAPTPPQKKDSAARRVLSYSQFVKEMVECTGETYRLENVDLMFNRETDTAFFPSTNDTSPLRNSEITNVRASVLLLNVHLQKFSPIIRFSNFQFQRGIRITIEDEKRDDGDDLWDFRNCVFYPITYQDGSMEAIRLSGGGFNTWRFYRCRFVNGIDISSCKISNLYLKKCRFEIESSLPFDSKALSISIDKSTIEGLTIDSCLFADYVLLAENNLTNVDIQSSTFNTLILTSTVLRELTIDNCEIDSAAGFYAAQFPPKSTAIPFIQIAGKLAIDNVTAFYRARTDADFANESDYNDLISIYTDFLSLYKTRGDQESYNACYVEMKQIHTRRAGYLYRKSPALESWFDWRLNQLLEIFSDYGTNSAKGLIYIFYVIVGFAALYLVFPSEADNLSREKSFRMFDVVIGYFSTNASLVNISEHKRRRALDDLQNFRTTLEVSRKDVPAFIALLGAPLYGLNKAYLGFSAWLVERFDIVPGRWNELSAGRKAWTGAAVSAYMLGFLVWGVVMRFVNAFALSINAFVTLGYGEIQARGVARYLAVLEGAVGWFLLSIFSVTLISQLLQ